MAAELRAVEPAASLQWACSELSADALEEAVPSLPVLPVQVGAGSQQLLDGHLLGKGRVCHQTTHDTSSTLETDQLLQSQLVGGRASRQDIASSMGFQLMHGGWTQP